MIIDFKYRQSYWWVALNNYYVEYSTQYNYIQDPTIRLNKFCEVLNDNNILHIKYINDSLPAIYEIEEDELLTLFILKNGTPYAEE